MDFRWFRESTGPFSGRGSAIIRSGLLLNKALTSVHTLVRLVSSANPGQPTSRFELRAAQIPAQVNAVRVTTVLSSHSPAVGILDAALHEKRDGEQRGTEGIWSWGEENERDKDMWKGRKGGCGYLKKKNTTNIFWALLCNCFHVSAVHCYIPSGPNPTVSVSVSSSIILSSLKTYLHKVRLKEESKGLGNVLTKWEGKNVMNALVFHCAIFGDASTRIPFLGGQTGHWGSRRVDVEGGQGCLNAVGKSEILSCSCPAAGAVLLIASLITLVIFNLSLPPCVHI